MLLTISQRGERLSVIFGYRHRTTTTLIYMLYKFTVILVLNKENFLYKNINHSHYNTLWSSVVKTNFVREKKFKFILINDYF